MLVLPALLVLSACSSAVTLPAESNGQRLTRGLPPLRPRFNQVHPGNSATPSFGGETLSAAGNFSLTIS
jgi:hypothetical protein